MTQNNGRQLLKRHLEELQRSGLNLATIHVARLYSESDPLKIAAILNWRNDAGELNPRHGLGSCIVFPFVSHSGEDVKYSRVRWDSPRPTSDRPAKYDSPVGSTNHIYLPPLARQYAKDASQPLLFTEGEKKSLVADQHGFACVGLVGAWGWKKPKDDDSDASDEFLDEMSEFLLHNRRVYIVLDSDTVYKELVWLAEWRLSQLLVRSGARVGIIRLPQSLSTKKVGLDDYLVANGCKEFEKLMAHPAQPTRAYVGYSNSVRVVNREKPTELKSEPRGIHDIALELVGRADGWPRVVGGLLSVPDGADGVRPVENHDQLFAFASTVFDRGGLSGVTWEKGTRHVSQKRVYEYLAMNCERFDRADNLPHVPPIDGVLYTTSFAPTNSDKALNKFLSFFQPASDIDKVLLVAAMLTPMWGGPPGKRPAFLFEAEDEDVAGGRGVGKSTVAQKIATIHGGAFDIDPSEPFHRTRSRLLTPDATGKRILLMDNVKTFRLSSADLESLVTNPLVNGHRYYHGQAGVPNYFTLFITLNGASLSRDFAQRVIPVRLKRAKMREGWEAEVDAFLESSRRELIGDLMTVLNRSSAKLETLSRWGPWETGVIAKLKHAEKALASVAERTADMDADGEDVGRVQETMQKIIDENVFNGTKESRLTSVLKLRLDSSAYTKLVEIAMNRDYTASDASTHLKSLGVPELRKTKAKGSAYWMWTGSKYPAECTKPAWQISYSTERKRWTVVIEGKTVNPPPDPSTPANSHLPADIPD